MRDEKSTTPRTMTLREAVDRAGRRLTFSSGSRELDRLIGGGLRTGDMIEAFGASGTAKTQLALQSALSVATAGFTCAYIDTEGQFRPERLSSICEARGLDPAIMLPLVYVVRAEDTGQQLDAVSTINETRALEACKMVIVDTVTKNFSLEFGGAGRVPARQAALGAYLNRLARDASAHDRTVLLLNRVASVGEGSEAREVDIGGETLRHFVSKAVRLRRQGDSVGASIEGQTPRAEVGLKITTRGLE